MSKQEAIASACRVSRDTGRTLHGELNFPSGKHPEETDEVLILIFFLRAGCGVQSSQIVVGQEIQEPRNSQMGRAGG